MSQLINRPINQSAEASNSPPRMTDHVSSMSATGGATVELPCVAIAIPVARYRWSKNGIPIRGGRSDDDDDDGDRISGDDDDDDAIIFQVMMMMMLKTMMAIVFQVMMMMTTTTTTMTMMMMMMMMVAW